MRRRSVSDLILSMKPLYAKILVLGKAYLVLAALAVDDVVARLDGVVCCSGTVAMHGMW